MTEPTPSPTPPRADAAEAASLALALSGTGTGTWDWHVQTGELLVNEAWAGMLGYTLAELAPITLETFRRLCHPDDLASSADLLRQCFEGGLYSFETRIRHRDGRWIWVLDRGTVVERAPDGTPIRLVGTHVDITELKEAREEAEIRQRLYRAVADQSGDPMLLTDLEGAILDANEAASRFLGYSREELLALTLRNVDADLRAHDAGPQRHVTRFREGEPILFETVQIRKDGTRVPVEVRAVRLGGPSGALLMGFIRDLSAQKRAEALVAARMRLSEAAFTRSSQELLRMFLDEAEALTGSSIGFYHFVDEDQEHIYLQEWSTNTVATMCKADGHGLHYPVSQAGVWVDCVRTRAPVVHNDYPSLPHRKGLPEGHAPVTRELVVPVLMETRITAILGVGNKPTPYDEGDVEVLSTMAREGWEIVLRRQAQERAQWEALRFREVINSSPDGFWEADIDGRLLGANEAYASMVGYELGELRGMHICDLTAPRRDLVMERIASARRGGVLRFDTVHRRKDGTPVEVEVSARYVESGGGRILAFVRDATERNRTLADLSRRQREYATLIGSLPDLILRCDERGNVLFESGRAEGYGLPRVGNLARAALDHGLGDRARAAVLDDLARAARGEAVRREFALDLPVGRRVFDCRLVPEGSEAGGPRSILIIARDVTGERKLAQDWQQLFRHVAEGVALCQMVRDESGGAADYRVVSANPAFARIFGHPLDDLHTLGSADLPPFDASTGLATFEALLASEGQVEFESVSPQGGRVVWVSGYPMGPDQFALVVTDVTEHRRAENQRSELEAHLRRAQKMEAIGTLAGGIAHDFNNILAAILGYGELAHEDAGDPELARAHVAEVLKAGRRAKDLVAQILAISRQGDQAWRPLRLVPIVKEALKLLRASIPTTIEIRTDLRQDAVTVIADATQIHQVLMNLCTNAFHALRARGGVLEVALGCETLGAEEVQLFPELAPGSYAVLRVTDDGPGIDPALLSRIFEPYFTTKRQGEGTGLGLAMVHGILTAHGGAVRVESAPGRGSTFRVYLPVSGAAPAEEPRDEKRLRSPGTERLLFVDDEEAICRMARDGLGRLGYAVRTFTDPRKATAVLARNHRAFDAVFTDLAMPGLSGVDFARRVREAAPALPVLMCSGFVEPAQREAAEAAGVRTILAKPLTPDHLAAALRRVLDGTG
ncbi:MAG TPA: PAS domain S-box protein [Longimicrobiales bacterium]|nr:PAS domain S-box protein [Longimicrobiales bacterium]